MIPEEKIFSDFESLGALLTMDGGAGYPEAARMLTPLIVELDSFIGSKGLDGLFETMLLIYRAHDNPEVKEVIVGLVSDALQRGRLKGIFTIKEAHVDYFVEISLRHVGRTLCEIFRLSDNVRSGKTIVYQNLRMGGMYPPMERPIKELLASKGYGVFEIYFDKDGVDKMNKPEILDYATEIKGSAEFKSAKIILTRFKVSSAPEPKDSLHPLDFIPLDSQLNKFAALEALAYGGFSPPQQNDQEIPVLMIDASKNLFSLAQLHAALPFITPFNAVDFMKFLFCHRYFYWLSNYGFNNIEDLLPASSESGRNGRFYGLYAEKIKEAVGKSIVDCR